MTTIEIFDKCTGSNDWITSGNNVQWKTWNDGGKQYIAFQETRGWREWVMACKVWPKRYFNTLAHAGYVNHFYSWLDEAIGKIDFTLPTVICGYSMGGALALLLARFMGDCEVVTFASPRVYFYGAKLENKITRYELRGDPVPHLPPCILGYKHVGEVVKLGDRSIIKPSKHYPASYREALETVEK